MKEKHEKCQSQDFKLGTSEQKNNADDSVPKKPSAFHKV
jgi:hypothetical protein